MTQMEEDKKMEANEQEPAGAGAAQEQTQEPGQLEQLQQRINQLEQQLAEEKNARLRALADLENFRRRARQEREELLKYEAEGLITALLPVIDNFERALAATGEEGQLRQGVEMIYRQLMEVLTRAGLTPMECQGQEFDPHLHQAVMQVPTEEQPENTIVDVYQKGYYLKDKVIRPAMVTVAVRN
ncbi:MAG: nucleotide exchange factor GrpE [Bacillota bacterium]|uniref:nucleotide exchange factor GrpE n=1 Tax=unclassified Carboxydocella TaxID=2685367 RepID=UPI0009D01F4C|nr:MULTISPECIES: nucleotide exchange factor GrpE [unclassified Carboxydocella]GAW28057.1 nucleotide exchange factor GrpE [Carboxydocella sp. ULO1]GAW31719.1 nucleotide exchange factor GrpE [Carboxydocella sp. JDF658]